MDLLWSGRTVTIVAGGPSLTISAVRMIAMAKASGKTKCLAVNDAVYPCWYSDVAYASDIAWWKHHDYIPGFPGLKLGLRYMESFSGPWRQPDGIEVVTASGKEGFEPGAPHIRHGGSSGYAALHVAIHQGPARIILVGFDMKGGHWFGGHPKGLRNVAPKREISDRFSVLAEVCRERGIDVVNASRDSALTFFRFSPLEDVL